MIIDDSIVAEPLLRNKIADYLNVSKTETPEFVLMGIGFNSLNENPNAQEHESNYISQSNSTTFVKGYKTEFPYDCDFIKADKAVAALYEVGRDHLTGTDAMFEYIRVDLYADSTADGYPARKFIVSAIPSETSGEGGGYIGTSGTLKTVGDFEEGFFDTAKKTFKAKVV